MKALKQTHASYYDELDNYSQQNEGSEPSQSQEEIINQIKQLGSEIFEVSSPFTENGELFSGFEEQFNKINQPSTKLIGLDSKHYSYTDRNHHKLKEQANSIMEDDWISSHDSYNDSMSDQYELPQKQQTKKPIKQNYRPVPPKKQEHKPINFKKNIIRQSQRNIDPIPSYLKPIKNIKPQTLAEIQQKKKKEEKELNESRFTINSHKSSTLDQLYKNKLPLYQKFIENSHAKKIKMAYSRMENEEKQMDGFIGKPQINTHIYVEGSFDQRLTKKQAKKEEHKVHITKEMMQPYTFKPKLSSSKKYQKIEPKVNNKWDQERNNQQIQDDEEFYRNKDNMKNLSKSLIRTGSFFSEDSNHHKNKSTQIKLKNPNQLSYILEIEDFEEM